MNSEKKNKHMQLEDRVEIQESLYRGMTFKAIAKRIGKDPTTVSKEVKLHAIDYKSGFTKTDDTCPKLLKAPFVCNGCEKQNHSNCIYPRRKYAAKSAALSAKRSGVRTEMIGNQSCSIFVSDSLAVGSRAIAYFTYIRIIYEYIKVIPHK